MVAMSWRPSILHPSTGRLRRWLDTGDDPGVGLHVGQCDRCADRLVELDAERAPDVPPTSELGQALSALLEPPADLGDRVRRSVELRWRAEQELALLAGLFAAGVETAQLMFADDADQDRPERPTDGHQEDTP